jgi:hypothetical protein
LKKGFEPQWTVSLIKEGAACSSPEQRETPLSKERLTMSNELKEFMPFRSFASNSLRWKQLDLKVKVWTDPQNLRKVVPKDL